MPHRLPTAVKPVLTRYPASPLRVRNHEDQDSSETEKGQLDVVMLESPFFSFSMCGMQWKGGAQ